MFQTMLQHAPFAQTIFMIAAAQAALRLVAEIKSASRSKLMFLRWAMYGTNKPDHAVHALTRQERARVWEELKAATQLANPAPAN